LEKGCATHFPSTLWRWILRLSDLFAGGCVRADSYVFVPSTPVVEAAVSSKAAAGIGHNIKIHIEKRKKNAQKEKKAKNNILC